MNWSRVEGRIGAANLRHLRQSRVGVVGLGSGGGFVALNLAMSGVGHFTLIDDDVLEPGNVVRHVCDLRAVGQPKATAVAELIRQRNPEAQIEAHIARIQERHEALDALDLLIVGVDGERTKFDVNAACLERGLVAVYAGVYERGEGGDVVVIRPQQGPCYACWAAQLREDMAELPSGPALDYGLSVEEQTLRAEPGLWLDVVRVAAAQSYFALTELLHGVNNNGDLRANTLVIANRDMEIFEGVNTPAQGVVWVEIERNPECLVCGEALRESEDRETPVSFEELSATISKADSSANFNDG